MINQFGRKTRIFKICAYCEQVLQKRKETPNFSRRKTCPECEPGFFIFKLQMEKKRKKHSPSDDNSMKNG